MPSQSAAWPRKGETVGIDDLTGDQIRRLVGIAGVTVRGRGGEPANVQTVRGYCRDGYKPSWHDGPPLVLRHVVMGQCYCTLPEWVEEFERERARLYEAARARPAMRPSARSRAAAVRRANEHLDAAGVK